MNRCDNCLKLWPDSKLRPIAHLGERLEPGGTVPSGECPDCGALCYPVRRSTKRLFLVEQDVTRLNGEYLTEALLVAATAAEALRGTVQLAPAWGVTVRRNLLTVYDLGPAPHPLPAGLIPRHRTKGIDFLVIGTGTDDSF